MSQHDPKWVPVDNGQLIPEGQPYAIGYDKPFSGIRWIEYDGRESNFYAHQARDGQTFYVDSTWTKPLDLPTEPTWGIVVGRFGVYISEWVKDGNRLRLSDNKFLNIDTDVRDFIPLTDEQVERVRNA